MNPQTAVGRRILLLLAPLVAFGIILQILSPRSEPYAKPPVVDGPGGGGGEDCPDPPCWVPTSILTGATGLAIQRKPCCLADRVAALVNEVGIYRSLDGGKTYTLAATVNSGVTTYNLAPTKCDGCGDLCGKGPIYAATSAGLLRSDPNTRDHNCGTRAPRDLESWSYVTTPTGAQNQTLPVTFVGSIVRWDGVEDIFITVDPGNATAGGLYKRTSGGGWTKVAANLNVTAMAPVSLSSQSTRRSWFVAVTRPCTGCAGGSLWTSTNYGESGTWSALPNGSGSGPKSAGFNDVALRLFGGTLFFANDDATIGDGKAVMRAPISFTSWDDVTFHDTTDAGGLTARTRTGTIREQVAFGNNDPGIIFSSDHLRVAALGNADGRTSGIYTGPASFINWVPWHSLNNAPSGARQWILTVDKDTNPDNLVVAIGNGGDIRWRIDTGDF